MPTSVQYHDFIDSLGYSLEEIASMNEAKREEILQTYFETQGLTAEELDTAKKQLADDLKELRNDLKDAAGRLEDLETGNQEDKQKVSHFLDELKKIEKALNEFQDQVKEVALDFSKHHWDYTDDSNVNISKLEEGDYTFVIGDGMGDLFSENNEELNDQDYLREEGIVNADGEVIRDLTGEGAKTNADIEKALEEKKELSERKNIFINTEGQHWTFQSRDEATGTTVFIVEENGVSRKVTLKNAGNANIIFKQGLTASDLALIQGWPESLLKSTYFGSAEKSFWEELHPITDEQRLSAIKGYKKIKEDIHSADPYTDGPLTGENETRFQEAVDFIFDQFDQGITTADSPEILSTLLQKWSDEGVSRSDQKLLIQHLVTSFFIKGKTLFTEFFSGAVAGMLNEVLTEDIPADEDPSYGSKITILLLKTQTDPSSIGDDTLDRDALFAGFFASKSGDDSTSVDGIWKNNTENNKVLQFYKILIQQGGGIPIESIKTIQESEKEMGTGATTQQVQISEDAYSEILSKVSLGDYQAALLETDGSSDSDYGDGTSVASARQHILDICNQLSSQDYTVNEMRQKIKEFIDQLDFDAQNDIANILIHLLHDFSPDLLQALREGSEGEKWANDIWNKVNQRDKSYYGDIAENKNETLTYLRPTVPVTNTPKRGSTEEWGENAWDATTGLAPGKD